MNRLPPEARKLIFGFLRPPDPALLRVRAVCRAWRDAVPFEELIGVKRETAEWLLGGKEVEWDERQMNSADFAVKNHWYPFTVKLPGTWFYHMWSRCHVDVGLIRYEMSDLSETLTVWKLHPESFQVEARTSSHDSSYEDSCLGCCQWKQTFFVITRSGGLLKLNPSESVEQTVERFYKMTDVVYKQLRQPFVALIPSLMSFFSTTDGENFWMLNTHRQLLLMEDGRDDLQIMAEDADFAQLIDSCVAYLNLSDGYLKLMHKKATVLDRKSVV